jgi:homoserine kinase
VDRATAYAPGSTSNLGPGFDCLGIAFTGKGDRVTVARGGPPGVRVAAVSDPRIPKDAALNTAAIAASAVLQRSGIESETVGLEITVEKGLPLAGGMGGSAASAVAGAVAANAVLSAGLSPAELLDAALEAETAVAGRHFNNVAPSLHGGAVLIVQADPPIFAAARVDAGLRLVLVTPAYGVETAAARAVLPAQLSRADAIAQAAHLGGLLLGLERGDGELIRAAMEDRIAEPARRPLYPGYAEARAAALAAGAFGVVVSGAGPTLVALASMRQADTVTRAFEGAYRGLAIDAWAHCAAVDEQGAHLVVL